MAKFAFTKHEFFTALSEYIAKNPEMSLAVGERIISAQNIVDFCTNENERLEKRAENGGKSKSATEEQNRVIAEIVTAFATLDRPVTITELVKEGNLPYTSQKVTALVGKLVKAEKVIRTEDKKKAYFALAE